MKESTDNYLTIKVTGSFSFLSILTSKKGFSALAFIMLISIIGIMYYHDVHSCRWSSCMLSRMSYKSINIKDSFKGKSDSEFFSPLSEYNGTGLPGEKSRLVDFGSNASDSIVFLHIQKTGGSFMERALTKSVKELKCKCATRRSCECQYPRVKEPWLICRFTNGGWPCGIHADWTELRSCVPRLLKTSMLGNVKRRLFMTTILRDPIARYLSEFRHVQRGATWRKALHMCGGRAATSDELGFCYSGVVWEVKSLSDFANCQHNLANNRQTRMLADLTLVNCYNRTTMPLKKRNKLLLKSAKENLKRMIYFALLEQLPQSQYMFEKTFGITFTSPFQQHDTGYAQEFYREINQSDIDIIKKVNTLDIELYQFAKRIFQKRMDKLVTKFGPPQMSLNRTAKKGCSFKECIMYQKNLRRGNKTREWTVRKKAKKKKYRQYDQHGVIVLK